MRGNGVGVASRIAGSGGHSFFVWTLIAIGVTGPPGGPAAGLEVVRAAMLAGA